MTDPASAEAQTPARTVLLAGASGASGLAVARALAADGTRVLAVARSQEPLDALVAQVPGADARACEGRCRNGQLRLPGSARSHHVDGQCDGAAFRRIQCTHADHLAIDFFTALIADGDHHRIFPGIVAFGVAERSFDPQRRKRRLSTPLENGFRVETQMVLASRTDTGAFKDGGLAVGAGPGPTGCRDAAVHAGLSALLFVPAELGPTAHARTGGNGQRAGFEIAIENADLQQLDA